MQRQERQLGTNFVPMLLLLHLFESLIWCFRLLVASLKNKNIHETEIAI